MPAASCRQDKHGEVWQGFYKKIGAKGGRNGHTGGFFADRELARIAGAKGGRISRRRKSEQVGKELKRVHTAPYGGGKRSVNDDHSPNAGGSFGFSGQ
jgi:hypothetical protein